MSNFGNYMSHSHQRRVYVKYIINYYNSYFENEC